MWSGGANVVVCVVNVVLIVVIVGICCGCDGVDHGELLVVISDGLAGCLVLLLPWLLLLLW